jgi:SAM-dependent methyltransferase
MPAAIALRVSCPACDEPVGAEPALRGRDRLHGLPGVFDVHLCPSCGSGVTAPPMPASELGRFYPPDYGAYALPANAALRVAATALFRLRYRRALQRIPLRVLRDRPPGRLLDVGSGRGDLGVVARELGWEPTGLEPSPEAAATARVRGVPTEVGTLETATLDPPYDVVLFQHSLEHVADPLADLVRAHSLLAGGGAVVVTVPNFGSWQARRFAEAWFHLDVPRHRFHFTDTGLRRVLERAGFDEVSISTSTSADGLPMSVEYLALGRRRRGSARYAEIAAILALTPLTVAADRAVGDGDVLHALAARP